MQNNNWKEREVGALWRVNGSKQSFYSGEILDKASGQKKKIVIFVNDKKDKSSNQPDLRIYESNELNESNSQ
jgi:hypothetical protein